MLVGDYPPLPATEPTTKDPMAIWIMFFVLWGITEIIQLLRKKPLRSRMKPAAWVSTLVAAVTLYGQAPRDSTNFITFLVGLAMFAGVALTIYWTRVWLAKMMSPAT